uniref:Gsp_37 putative toxin n=1 Tax=Gemmula speciosa TaxID=439592 RepID=A0A098LWA8_GEMSP
MRMSMYLVVFIAMVTAGRGVAIGEGGNQPRDTASNTDKPECTENQICWTQYQSTEGFKDETICTCPSPENRCVFDSSHTIRISDPQYFTKMYTCNPVHDYVSCGGQGNIAVTHVNEMKFVIQCKCHIYKWMSTTPFTVQCVH